MKHVCGTAKTRVEPVDDKMVQPNAIDLRVKAIYKPVPGTFRLMGDKKEHLTRQEIKPEVITKDEAVFTLTSGVYLVEFEQIVTMGEKEAGVVLSRSTLMRNGVWMTTCLYDSGYHGKMISGLHVPEGVTFVFPKGERLAQFIVMDAESLHQYHGSYQEPVSEAPEDPKFNSGDFFKTIV